MTLYELSGQWSDLMSEWYAAETDEDREAVEARMECCGADITDKAGAYAKVMLNINSEIESLKSEIKRLEAMKKRREGVVERLKANLLYAMNATCEYEIKTDIGTWKSGLNPYSVEVIDANAVPATFRIPQPDAIDKQGIKAWFKASGEAVPGVRMIRTEKVSFR